MAELVIGLKNGKAFHISEVDRGLACGCVCPECGSLLVAKKGAIKAEHFAHKGIYDCGASTESGIHLLAKQILSNGMQMTIPAFKVEMGIGSIACVIDFDEVRVEPILEGMRPDLIVLKNNQPLIIEMKYTHAVDPVKINKIKQSGIAAIEVDISHINLNDINGLRELILVDTEHKTWLYNRKESFYKSLVDEKKNKTRLLGWWDYDYEGYSVFKGQCPFGVYRNTRPCSDCEYFLDYEQGSQESNGLKSPSYIYCSQAGH